MNIKFPCLGCEERHIGCHGKCDRYLQAVEESRKPDAQKRAEQDYNQFLAEGIFREKKRCGRIKR